ncbi:MAG: bifunctional (p)ppGpp synthetase/guanosine-3',5'-bis(diphosphate) 3'-pyrophosphohydrolase [Actinomycetota bacterium]|nr:bifunctional (p)ppGpp synthetase/guanosine-3',5'-bis(diphosphate) 3'-pyrophosphohydrolase [Actinomycetota bacterium]
MKSDENVNRLFSLTKKFLSKSEQKKLEKAYQFAFECHKDQYRKSGEHFIEHPLTVATYLAQLKLDADTICAGLLHDVVEDSELTLDDVREEFGEEISSIIDGLTKLERFRFNSREEQQAENMRRMLIAVAKDVRVILVKLADRLHNMETISALPSDRRREIAEETLEIYAPLAHRFGISQVKWRLEDLSFEVLHPERYRQVQEMVAEKRREREKYLGSIEKKIETELRRNKIKASVSGRVKHFFSIYEKMVNRGIEFDEIMDLSAVRVIVESIKDCYAALGIIHSIWKPVPGRFRDYIAMPKLNMYQSLHTVVMSHDGKPIEIQIRTKEMHRTAEFGIAAHWLYKEQKREHHGKAWLKQVMDWQEMKDPTEFMRTLKIELFQDEVFVFSPRGKLISLPKGATPIDFAYQIHTEVGHSCIGAKVNGKMVPLSYELQNGNIVEIITSKTPHGPSIDWLQIVKSARARSKIRQWFSQERREEEKEEGRELLERSLRKTGLPVHSPEVSKILSQVASECHAERLEDLYVLIGCGQVSTNQVASKVSQYLGVGKRETIIPEKEEPKKPPEKEKFTRRIIVNGIENALVQIAQCCNPVPGDKIVGFVTRGRGVSVHKEGCPNFKELSIDSERILDVSWEKVEPVRVVEICVKAIDRPKLVRDITVVLGDRNVNIISAAFSTNYENLAVSNFVFEVASGAHLDEILREIRKVDSVYDVFEVTGEKVGDKGESGTGGQVLQ